MDISLRQVNAMAVSTLRAGGIIENAFFPETVEELTEFYRRLGGESLHICGGLTNTLVLSGGVKEKTVFTDFLRKAYAENDCLILGAGEKLAQAAYLAEANALSGLEGLCSIPGTVGAALCGNAGAFSTSLSDVVERATVFELDTGEVVKKTRDELKFSYRQCLGLRKNRDLILSVRLKLLRAERERVSHKMFVNKKARELSQPQGKSLGCAFKNPEGRSAGKLIDEAGLKGYVLGGMKISEKHANFIVNDRGGTPEDYLGLLELAERAVYEKFGVKLQREVVVVGKRN